MTNNEEDGVLVTGVVGGDSYILNLGPDDECIYIAGRYSGKDYNEIDRHIALAREAASALAQANVTYFCPHQHSQHMEAVTPEVDYEFWIKLDLHFLRNACTAVLLLPDWEKSSGARNEKLLAEELGYPIFYDVASAIQWYRDMTSVEADSAEEN